MKKVAEELRLWWILCKREVLCVEVGTGCAKGGKRAAVQKAQGVLTKRAGESVRRVFPGGQPDADVLL